MKSKNEKGSVLILVLIGVLILSFLGFSGLSQSITDLAISRSFVDDKIIFFYSESGINFGINMLRDAVNPGEVVFESTNGNLMYKSGKIEETIAQPVAAFTGGLKPPPPKGMSVEMCGELGVSITAWDLLVSAKKDFCRKELESIVLTISFEY